MEETNMPNAPVTPNARYFKPIFDYVCKITMHDEHVVEIHATSMKKMCKKLGICVHTGQDMLQNKSTVRTPPYIKEISLKRSAVDSENKIPI